MPTAEPRSRLVNANIALLLEEQAARHGRRVAIRDGDRHTDYRALHAHAWAVCAMLRAAGVTPGMRVALMLERGATSAGVFFGIAAAGGIAVLINESLRTQQVDQILTHSGAEHLVTTPDLLASLPRPLQSRPLILDPGEPPAVVHGAAHAEGLASFRLGDDVAQIVYTSGSTGAPKGVMVSHANLRAAMTAVIAYLGLTPHDRIASLLPFGFVYGMSQLLCAVGVGATLVVERSTLPREIMHVLERERVTVVAAVPPIWLRLLKGGGLGETRLPALRVMTNAGGHLPVEAVRALRAAQRHARLFLMYGLTEALRSTYLPPEEVDRIPDSIGRAIPGTEVFVVDDHGAPVLPGEVGELVQRGPTVTLGYWRDPEQTARVFRPDPRGSGDRVVFSGDLVRADADGFLYYVSRKDRLIKTMGWRVGPDEVLDLLHASGQVTDAAVAGEPDPIWGQRIVAYVVLAPGGSIEALNVYCGREAPRHLRPARYEVRDAIPLLPSGKHDLTALRPVAVA